jgi:hypothetical protein
LVLLIFPEFTDYSFGAQIVLTEHFYPDDWGTLRNIRSHLLGYTVVITTFEGIPQ